MIKMTKTMLFAVAGVAGVFCFGNAFAEDAAPVAAVVSPVTQQIDIPEKIQDLDKVKITYDGQTYACPDRCRFETYSNGGYVLPPRCVHKQTGAECKAMVSAAQSNSSNQAVIVVPLKVESVNLKADEVSDAHKKANANVAARAAKAGVKLVEHTDTVSPVNIKPQFGEKLASSGMEPDCVCLEAGCVKETVVFDGFSAITCKRADGTECKMHCDEKVVKLPGTSSARAAKMQKVKNNSSGAMSDLQASQEKLGTVIYNCSCPSGCTRVQTDTGGCYCYKYENGVKTECDAIWEKIDTQQLDK